MTIKDYLNLIPSANALQPNFNATITADVTIPVQVQALLTAMLPLFDLGTPPVGNQLDIIGQWVGVSRTLTTPISNVFFTWDNINLGWDHGSWQPPGNPGNITQLPDDAYLILILARIAANTWDGTTDGAYRVWDELVGPQGITILIQDYQNMSYSMGIVGNTIPPITLALITSGEINLRPEGVKIVEYFSGPAPFFAWDSNTPLLQGWDHGKWATETFT